MLMYIASQSLKRPDWLQIWAGGWSLLSCSHFAEQYVRLIKFNKIPCITGTKIATQVFKDGDLVEVDADKGIVRKL